MKVPNRKHICSGHSGNGSCSNSPVGLAVPHKPSRACLRCAMVPTVAATSVAATWAKTCGTSGDASQHQGHVAIKHMLILNQSEGHTLCCSRCRWMLRQKTRKPTVPRKSGDCKCGSPGHINPIDLLGREIHLKPSG